MAPISFPEFDRIYQPGVSCVLEHWTPAMQTELALHCHGWRPEAVDLGCEMNYRSGYSNKAPALNFFLGLSA